MKNFVFLIKEIDQSLGNNEKKRIIKRYFSEILGLKKKAKVSTPKVCEDTWQSLYWAIKFLCGEKIRGSISTAVLRKFLSTKLLIQDWLIEESYQAVGDLAETVAHLCTKKQLSNTNAADLSLNEKVKSYKQLCNKTDNEKIDFLAREFTNQDYYYIFTVCKLFTGGFRLGISRLQVGHVLSDICGISKEEIASRLILLFKANDPDTQVIKFLFNELLEKEKNEQNFIFDTLVPVPFFLSHPLSTTGAQDFFKVQVFEEWVAEWKWDGARCQLIAKRSEKKDGFSIELWTRGEEFVSEKFPEIINASKHAVMSDIILDGELLIWDSLKNMPEKFQILQKRLGKKRVSLKEKELSKPVFMIYDVLFLDGQDLRLFQFQERRTILEKFFYRYLKSFPEFLISPQLEGASWLDYNRLHKQSRSLNVEGLMLKRRSGFYGLGRTKGKIGFDSFKWKIPPLSVDAVIIYAQRGHGIRSGLYSDYTFGVINDEKDSFEIVPFTKAYSGLTSEDLKTVDKKIKKLIEDSFGPVKKVKPEIVVELNFDSIALSKRHKSGVAVRFPRMKRLRFDKKVEEIDRLSTLKNLL